MGCLFVKSRLKTRLFYLAFLSEWHNVQSYLRTIDWTGPKYWGGDSSFFDHMKSAPMYIIVHTMSV